MSEVQWEMMITFPTDVRATKAAGTIDGLFDAISDFFRAEGIQNWAASCSMVRDEEADVEFTGKGMLVVEGDGDADPEVS